jgi:Pectate lyase superfamily protein
MWRILVALFILFCVVASDISAIPHFTFLRGFFNMPNTSEEITRLELLNDAKYGTVKQSTAANDRKDEFLGPFPSWANLKTRYGAVGDGNSDDTQALQAALNDLGKTGNWSVLYLPAGTYKITNQLDLSKAKNVAIVGESPDVVTLQWAGAVGGTMLRFQNDAYTRLQRITFDGNNTASNGLWIRWDGKTDNFPTTFDISDNVFKNLQVGVRGGKVQTDDGHQDTASEVAIYRNKFIGNSAAGIVVKDWNTVNWWIRESLFENNKIGVKGIVGTFNVSNSVFKNSIDGDIYGQNNFFIGLRNNYSIGSPYFYQTGATTTALPATIQGNTILNSTDSAIQIKTPGPATLLANTIQNSEGNSNPAVTFGGLLPGNYVAVGNTFSVQNPIKVDPAYNRFLELDTSVKDRSTINTSEKVLPLTPKQATAPVIEVDALSGASIQAAIDRAARDYSGQRPVVHIPAGKYDVSSTITIPAGSDLRLVGDTDGIDTTNSNTNSLLIWKGDGSGPVLSIQGQSHAVVQDIAIDGSKKAQGVVVNNVDRPGGRIFLNQANVNPFGAGTTGVALRVEGLDYTTVDAVNTSIGGNSGAIRVLGGPLAIAGQPTTARVNLYGGTYGSFGAGPTYQVDNGGRLIVRDVWYENGNTRTPILQLTSSNTGNITLDNLYQQYHGNAAGSSSPTIAIDGFSGQVTINGIVFLGASVEVKGNNPAMNVLLLGSNFSQNDLASVFSNSATAGQVSFLENWISDTRFGGYRGEQYPNLGTTDPNWLGSMLAPLIQDKLADRSLAVPADATDLTLLRVGLENVSDGFVILP